MIAIAAEAVVSVEAIEVDVAKTPSSPKEKNSSSEPKDRLEAYIKLMEDEDLHELEISDGPFQLKLVREPKQSVVMAGSPVFSSGSASDLEPGSEKAAEAPGTHIKSPLGGIFYRSPSPKSPAFVKEGDTIVPGQTLGIVEAMKVMNEIKSEVSGRILKILVENGKPVEPNQTMFIVEPA